MTGTVNGSRLYLYRQSLTEANGPVGGLVSVELHVAPADQITRVELRIPARFLGDLPTGPLVLLGTRTRGAGQQLAPAITRLRAEGAARSCRCRRRASSPTTSWTEIDVPDLGAGGNPEDDLTITFMVWELVSPLFGQAPYVQASLDLVLDFPSLPDESVLVTLSVPRDTEPRSIQGTHVLAYPSHTFEMRRYMNLYFRRDRPIRLTGSFGATNEVTDIWLSFAKVAGAAALVAFLNSLKREPGDTERLLAVLASLATLLGVSTDLLRQFAELRIYRNVGRWLQRGLMLAQVAGVVVIALSLLRLRGGDGPVLGAVVPLAVGLAIADGIVLAAGLVLHYLGLWHRFVCDSEGCRSVLHFRKGRPECSYTGRVFCNTHIGSVCSSCIHHPDLLNGTLETADRFDPRTIPCRPQEAPA